jgi:drug/metabolite transporter (DMT)-like permease
LPFDIVVLGECSNFLAYGFSPAIIVTPLGAISVVVGAVLSKFVLGERITFTGVCGILLCVIGSLIIVLHGPPETASETIPEFFEYVVHPLFLSYSFLCLLLVIYIIIKLEPVYGSTQPAVYLTLVSIGGAFLVNAAQGLFKLIAGLGSSILYSIRNWNTDNQFLYWEMYPLIAFAIASAVFQIIYLNRSLHHFSANIVTPVEYGNNLLTKYSFPGQL